MLEKKKKKHTRGVANLQKNSFFKNCNYTICHTLLLQWKTKQYFQAASACKGWWFFSLLLFSSTVCKREREKKRFTIIFIFGIFLWSTFMHCSFSVTQSFILSLFALHKKWALYFDQNPIFKKLAAILPINCVQFLFFAISPFFGFPPPSRERKISLCVY